jgi:hypothetical protein
MVEKRFRSFLESVAQKLFPEEDVEILSPESPPDWRKLGWKVGYIIEEGHTGLQWWVTKETDWDELAGVFGANTRLRKQSFARWYGELLDEWAGDLGVPLNLESLKFRKMDMTAFEGRPLIEDEDWWSVRIGSDEAGYWTLLFTERFLCVFEQDVESSPEPDPPWTFLELWQELEDREARDLLQKIGTEEGLLNHLGSLVVAGNLDYEDVAQRMARQPREEFERVVDQRRNQLEGTGSGRRDQTLDRWRDDAITHLTQQVGEWLESGELPEERWKRRGREWDDYRRAMLEETFGEESWIQLWRNLDFTDLKQVLPRLEVSLLGRSLERLSRADRREILKRFPDSVVEKLLDRNPDVDHREVLETREELFEQGKSVIESMDYELEGLWNTKNNQESD